LKLFVGRKKGQCVNERDDVKAARTLKNSRAAGRMATKNYAESATCVVATGWAGPVRPWRLEQIHFPSRPMSIIFQAASYRLIAIVRGVGPHVVKLSIDRRRSCGTSAAAAAAVECRVTYGLTDLRLTHPK